MRADRRATRQIVIVLFSLLTAVIGASATPAMERSGILLIQPGIDWHDRLRTIVTELEPAPQVAILELERRGGRESRDWGTAFGSAGSVSLDGVAWAALENAPNSALRRLTDAKGHTLDHALVDWVRAGGHLLVVGGSPSFETYRASALAEILPVVPRLDDRFSERRSLTVSGENHDGVVHHLHEVAEVRGQVRLRANRTPLVVEGQVGAGRVVVVLAGTQGQLHRDGADAGWFATESWARFVRAEIDRALPTPVTKASTNPPIRRATPPPDAFDIRYFHIGNHPYPFALAPGEASTRAAGLASAGFTSVVFKANPNRPLDDQRALTEIADAGLRIVYYESLRRESGRHRFHGALPARAASIDGKTGGWDVHDERFRAETDQLLTARDILPRLPLRGLQLIEEFKDGGMRSPSLTAQLRAAGLTGREMPGSPSWIVHEQLRATATHETFLRFRAAGKRQFPSLPQSTYWPASYWHRPMNYTWRLAELGSVADELLPPGYGYGSGGLRIGRLSVQRAAAEAFAGFRHGIAPGQHLAVYALGRPLRFDGPAPDGSSWRETAWTALAHGATGLAYWAAPTLIAAEVGPLHEELARLGRWLRGAPRRPAKVAVLESWTSRSMGDEAQARQLSACLQRVGDAIALGFEEVGFVFEENLDRLPGEIEALVLVASPDLNEAKIPALGRFLARGGYLLVDGASAKRAQPGGRPLDLATELGHPDRIRRIPHTAGCLAARGTPIVASRAWERTLRGLGLVPEAWTPELDTAATLRGTQELMFLFLVNHRAEPGPVDARLPSWLSALTWRDLRSNAPREIIGNKATTSGDVPARDAAVWVGVRRPATRLEGQILPDATEVQAFNAEGRPVVDGYPIELRDTTGTRRGAVLVDGKARFPGAPIGTVEVRDPVTGLVTTPTALAEGVSPK